MTDPLEPGDFNAVLQQMARKEDSLDLVAALLPGGVLHDVSSGARVIDVSEWGRNVDWAFVQRLGDPVLICFGTHSKDECPLGSPRRRGGEAHGIVFDVLAARSADALYVHRFSEAVKADQPITVRMRMPAEDAVLRSPEARTERR